jgi:hypothetical protein
MRGDPAQLPVDFLVGFTIFILCLIVTANFVPSLLVGLQRTSGIDYDAVAYRTAVVLVEDPGETSTPVEFPIGGNPEGLGPVNWRPWELRVQKEDVSRFGLALTRITPNILSINKINRFFNRTAFSYDQTFGIGPLNAEDYRKKLFFSTYQYGYNITLKNISPMKPGEPVLNLSVGEPYPSGSYGYIRRYVVIKQNSDGAPVDMVRRGPEFNATLGPQVAQNFSVLLDGSVLYNRSIDTPFKIDLQREPVVINISGLHRLLNNSDPNLPLGNNTSPIACKSNMTSFLFGLAPLPGEWNGTAPTNATLTAVNFGTATQPTVWTTFIPSCGLGSMGMCVDLEIEGQHKDLPLVGVKVEDKINLSINYIDASYFYYQPPSERDFVITFSFDDSPDPPHTLITGSYLLDYNRTNMTQPFLSTGMLEVGVW